MICFLAGRCSMGNTNAQGLEQASQGECHGRENSLTRKLSPSLHSPSSMVLNGSKCNYQYYIPFSAKCYTRFLGEISPNVFSHIHYSSPLLPEESLSVSAFIGNSVAGKFLRAKPMFHTCRFPSLEVKATDGSNKSTKPNSIVCADCDGNVACLLVSLTAQQQVSCNCTCCAISCTQCKGLGVNSVDHFNGQFKAGGLCWLCRGKREILCGSCNGAGFIGGFMSTFDE
ncbi:hypothetical protein NC651_038545 [Populus alba x Populus x berolinensis]|nr:hypothetical protein NC651_038545 [Populus alba x Populus x berolinensis]